MYWPLAAAAGELGSLTSLGRAFDANSGKITGMTAFSQKAVTTCSGEYESNDTPSPRASSTARSSDPGKCTVSASVKSNHSPQAARAPVTTALFFPVQPLGRVPASTIRIEGNDEAISRVRSVEWSSTTMISKATPVCPTNEARHVHRQASSLRAGTITDTMGVCVMVSVAVIVSVAATV